MDVAIERLETSEQGTFGRLVAGEFICFTGELPDRGNQRGVSCIPVGKYQCAWTFSPAFRRNLYLVVGVPGRSGVRFHAANLMGDRALGFRAQLEGCIALGERIGALDGQKAVLLSAPAMRKFELLMAGRPFELEIA